jgi:hypothetical protein
MIWGGRPDDAHPVQSVRQNAAPSAVTSNTPNAVQAAPQDSQRWPRGQWSVGRSGMDEA